MNCHLCKKDIGILIVLLPLKQSTGELEILACYECAKKSGAYCLKHERPHLGFNDGTTACVVCINEEV